MSDLRPRGVPIQVNGVERHLLFTLNAVDAVQDKFGKTLHEVLGDIAKEYPSGHTMRDVVMILLDDEVERERYRNPGSHIKQVTEQELGWEIGADNYMLFMEAVYHAYGVSLPDPEDDDPNRRSGQQSS